MKINSKEIYSLLKKIPEGKVTTYGLIAKKIGSKSYRGVGKIIGQNQDIPNTPCHRVVRSDGTIGGYALGIDNKIKLLKSENIAIKNNKILDFAEKIYYF